MLAWAELLTKVWTLPRWLLMSWCLWLILGIALAIPLVYATYSRWPKDANAAANPGSAGSGGSTNTVIQESKGTNSPNIVGNNNVVNMPPTSKPTVSKGRLKVEDRSSEYTADGIRESIVFGNTGLGDTYLVALRVRDRANEQVAVYRAATGRVQPGLPVTIKRGNPQIVTIQLTKEEAGRAHWIEWQSENNKWEGLPWNKGLHHYKVELSERECQANCVTGKSWRARVMSLRRNPIFEEY